VQIFQNLSLYKKTCVSSNATKTKRQMTLSFTDDSTIVGPQYVTWFVSLMWRSEFGRGAQIFRNFVQSPFTLILSHNLMKNIRLLRNSLSTLPDFRFSCRFC